MFTFLAIVHVVVSVLLVVFILLQDPKGGGGALGMLGGGSSKSLFGSTGGNQFLVNVTKWLAVIFAFTSIYLATLSSQKEKSVMDDYIPTAQKDQVDSPESEVDEKEADKGEKAPSADEKEADKGETAPSADKKEADKGETAPSADKKEADKGEKAPLTE